MLARLSQRNETEDYEDYDENQHLLSKIALASLMLACPLAAAPAAGAAPAVRLPSRGFTCEIENFAGTELCRQGPYVLATTHEHGAGRVHWVPSLIGLGAWRGDRQPLAEFLRAVAAAQVASVPFRFAERSPSLLLRTLQHGGAFVTVTTNGGEAPCSCRLIHPEGLGRKYSGSPVGRASRTG